MWTSWCHVFEDIFRSSSQFDGRVDCGQPLAIYLETSLLRKDDDDDDDDDYHHH